MAPSLREGRWGYTGSAETAGATGKGQASQGTPELGEDGGPSAAEAGSVLLLATEGRCFLDLLMCRYGAGAGNR